jgi:hypothetical protein
MQISCQSFAKMLIHFYFGKFPALRISPIFSEGHTQILFHIDGSNSFAYIMHAIMIIMRGRIVTRYLKSATEDMLQNNHTEIRCLCRSKKVLDPFSSCLKEHAHA